MDTKIRTTTGAPTWHIAVLIPARNEERLLPRCLKTVGVALSRLPHGVTSDIVVVSDCSTDRTAEIAQDCLLTRGTAHCTQAGNVGVARSLAAHIALARSRVQPERCWLANTDADCEVPETWLTDHLCIAERGYAAVTGIVDVQDFSEHRSVVEERFRTSYRIHADGTHSHVHGANLGVRADAYLKAGGWGGLATAEDHDLWLRLQQAGAAVLSDAALRVVTSGRRIGRAPMGFAAALARHNFAPVSA